MDQAHEPGFLCRPASVSKGLERSPNRGWPSSLSHVNHAPFSRRICAGTGLFAANCINFPGVSSAATSRHLDGTGHVCSVGRRENFQRRCGHISKNEIHPSFVKKLQTYMKGNRQTLKVLSASSPGARDREGHSSCVAMKTKEATLVANVKHYAMMRAIQDEEYQELHEIIECMNERRGKTHVHD